MRSFAEWGQGFMENDGDLEGLLGVGGTGGRQGTWDTQIDLKGQLRLRLSLE